MGQESQSLVINDEGGEKTRIRLAKIGERVRISMEDRDDIVAASMTSEQALELARMLLLCIEE